MQTWSKSWTSNRKGCRTSWSSTITVYAFALRLPTKKREDVAIGFGKIFAVIKSWGHAPVTVRTDPEAVFKSVAEDVNNLGYRMGHTAVGRHETAAHPNPLVTHRPADGSSSATAPPPPSRPQTPSHTFTPASPQALDPHPTPNHPSSCQMPLRELQGLSLGREDPRPQGLANRSHRI
jgi:hypothetical protein